MIYRVLWTELVVFLVPARFRLNHGGTRDWTIPFHSVAGYFTNMSVHQHLRLQISHQPTVPHREPHSCDGG